MYSKKLHGDREILALEYQLGNGSLCIDPGIPDNTGLNLFWVNLFGNFRIWDGGVNGERVYMGPYEYRASSCITGIEIVEPVKSALELTNYPNPLTGKTTIVFVLTENSMVGVAIYNQLVQLIKTLVHEKLTLGTYQVD